MAGTLECDHCKRNGFRSAAGLASHRRWKHSDSAGPESLNARALEVTLEALRKENRISPVDEASVQLLRSVARAVDENPANAALYRLYREALRELMGVDERGNSGGGAEAARAAIQRAAEVGDSSP